MLHTKLIQKNLRNGRLIVSYISQFGHIRYAVIIIRNYYFRILVIFNNWFYIFIDKLYFKNIVIWTKYRLTSSLVQ